MKIQCTLSYVSGYYLELCVWIPHLSKALYLDTSSYVSGYLLHRARFLDTLSYQSRRADYHAKL